MGERKLKVETRALYPVFSLKIRFYSYLVENSQKATLNFHFESGFSVKPSKFQIYFANDFRSKKEPNPTYYKNESKGFILIYNSGLIKSNE